ncbi:RNA polymerase sigma factor [Pararhodonellum marinum]|uniref:RNA polymerase sigma factor n=1 Tax=Pararhodonellum marinum TaxID=2755358 RepID=UPI00188F0810|nr:RNA polymerase sigma factor [Pararhodonellum marinum]
MNKKETLFHKITKESQDSIFRICLSFVGRSEDLNDLKQDIYLQIWKSMDQFRGESTWKTYIFRIAYNTAIKYKSRQKPSTPLPENYINKAEEPFQTQGEKSLELDLLHKCIQKLAEGDRLLVSFMLEDLTYKEIADVLQLEVNHVGVKINRVKRKLAKLIESENGKS